jgi:integrase
MPTLQFTKQKIDAISNPASGQVLYRDTLLRGFGLRVGSNSKVFVVEGQVRGKTCRYTIGRTDIMSVDAARKEAMQKLSDMARGIDPNEEKRRKAIEAMTVSEAFKSFFETRTSLAPGTVDAYQRTANLYLKDWAKTSITTITRQAVLKRHQKIAKEHGEVTANNVMRHFRSVYNVTAAGHDVFPPNPVNILTQARAWYPERRRRTLITPSDLPAWWVAVMDEPEYARDFLLVALFTGMRRNEIARLRWENIDLKNQTVHLPKTKNGDPLDLPLSGYLVDLLNDRKAAAGKSPWVFPSSSACGHIVETKKFTDRVTARSGVEFTLHDLRRTFITIAESLDIPHYALKRMLNHKISGDVTAGYIVSDIERLRGPVSLVASRILQLATS